MKETQLLQSKAYDHLIGLIKDGKLKEGEYYSLNKMAQEAGVSRTPFRDAVLRLEQERYIDIFPSKGFTLHKMTAEDILENPTYVILNLARVLAFRKEGAVLSKREGGEWALGRLPAQYRGLVAAALADYAGDAVPGWDAAAAAEYAAYMLAEIRRP